MNRWKYGCCDMGSIILGIFFGAVNEIVIGCFSLYEYHGALLHSFLYGQAKLNCTGIKAYGKRISFRPRHLGQPGPVHLPDRAPAGASARLRASLVFRGGEGTDRASPERHAEYHLTGEYT